MDRPSSDLQVRKDALYRGLTLGRVPGGGVDGNHVDIETGNEYWVSGVNQNREDRHWAGSGRVEIDPDVKEEYRRPVDGS